MSNSSVATREHNKARGWSQCSRVRKQVVTKDGEVVVDYKLNEDYEPLGSDPSNEPATNEEDKEDSNAKYQ